MRKVLYALRAVFLALIVLVVGGVGYLAYVGNKLDAEAKAYVDEAVPDDVRTAFALFAKLGPLMQYNGSKGEAAIFASVSGGQTITAKCRALATFKDGDASIDIELDKPDGAWKIRVFRVNSTAMMEKAVGRAI